MNAWGGSVWWNAVSNTATCGTMLPNTCCDAEMPARPGGLCSGASTDACGEVVAGVGEA
jgi:hypothetical protein